MVESDVEKVDDNYGETDLPHRSKTALAFADAFLGAQGPPDAATINALNTEFSPAEIAEMLRNQNIDPVWKDFDQALVQI